MEEINVDSASQNNKNILSLNPDEAFDRAGGFGKYQYIVFVFLIICSYASVGFIFILPYEFMDPPTECQNADGTWTSCNHQHACLSGVVYRHTNSYQNLMARLNLYCDEMSFQMLYVSFFIGSLIGGILFNILADISGRLRVVTAGITGLILSLVFLMFKEEYYFFLIIIGFIGFFTMGTAPSMSFTYESAHSQYIPFFSTLWQVIFSLCEIVVAVIMFMKFHWRISILILIILILSYYFLLPYLRETVKFFLCKGEKEKAKETIAFVAKLNKISDFPTFEWKSENDAEAKLLEKKEKLNY